MANWRNQDGPVDHDFANSLSILSIRGTFTGIMHCRDLIGNTLRVASKQARCDGGTTMSEEGKIVKLILRHTVLQALFSSHLGYLRFSNTAALDLLYFIIIRKPATLVVIGWFNLVSSPKRRDL